MTVTLNARGLKCPWPALRLARAMRDADTVLIEADDPAAPGEIAALARHHGWNIRDQSGAILIARPPR